ncbi:glycolate oxidase FAD binding subunit [Catenulispora sp. GAS73]|uniref:FAD-binding oxidoreductase n=1 Tax=Catenulispora sp. GAS73 TaxID=3156269 RepID=UPI0035125160
MVGASSSSASTPGGHPSAGGSSASHGSSADGAPTFEPSSGPRSITPTTVKDLRDAVTTNGAVLIRGTGTATTWGAPVRDARTTVSLAGMDRVLDYRPADMTVHVQGGIRLDALQEELAEHGQWLPYDPARSEATIGGLLATGDAGPRRMAYGSLRELVIGATMVFPDGAIAKSGGHVIKNVAGYDLAKLCHGSLGTLGVVVELVLRVHPLPQTSRTVMARDVDTATAQRLTWALTKSAIEPTAVEWCEPEQVLAVRFDGTADGAAARAAAARSMLTGSLAELDEGEAHSFWESHAARVVAEPGDTVMRAATRPGVDPALVGALSAWADRAGVKALLTCSPATGAYTVRITGSDAKAHAEVVKNWRASVEAVGGFVMLRRRRPGVDAMVESWGRAPGSVEVMRRVKGNFDPENRFAPGRFAPWF